MKITVSAIKADIGAIGGHTRPSDELLENVKKTVSEFASKNLRDYYVGYTGDVTQRALIIAKYML
jgi:fructose 1,6-bisphosphate aldolase/phosphatase